MRAAAFFVAVFFAAVFLAGCFFAVFLAAVFFFGSYTPKNSSKAQLLEAKENLQRMLAAIPLTEDERAVVDDGRSAVEALLARLTDIPTPASPTPRDLGPPATATMLPIVEVRQGKQE